MTPAQIISRFGGATALAAALRLPSNDVGAKRVRAWAMRGRIPAEYWSRIVAYSREASMGVSLEDLAEAHAPLAEAA